MPDARSELLALLKEKSFATGEFKLASGKTSNYYIDCRMTTLDARGACLIGEVLLDCIQAEAGKREMAIDAVGGLTMGADPIAVAVSMTSSMKENDPPIHAYCVRKEPKGHGKGKQVEGNFAEGSTVVVLDDVITTGGSTLQAIEAVEREGGKVAFVGVLVDRQEGGRENIENAGYPVVSAFEIKEFF